MFPILGKMSERPLFILRQHEALQTNVLIKLKPYIDYIQINDDVINL